MDMKFLPAYCHDMIEEILFALSDEDLDHAIRIMRVQYRGMNRRGFNEMIEANNSTIEKFVISTPSNRLKKFQEYDQAWISAVSIASLMNAEYIADIADIIPAQMNRISLEYGKSRKREATAALVGFSYDRLLPPTRIDVLKRLKAHRSLRNTRSGD